MLGEAKTDATAGEWLVIDNQDADVHDTSMVSSSRIVSIVLKGMEIRTS
jgi:hypothetical protein